jgi:hypothetical protein
MENSKDISQKIKLDLSYDPAIPVLKIYPRKKKLILKKIYTSLFIVAQFTIAKK